LNRLLSIFTMVLCVACADAAGPEATQTAALIRYAGRSARIVVPDTVARGIPFAVTVETFGGGCTRTMAPAEVRTVAAGFTRLSVFNWTVNAANCTDDLMVLTHQLSVRLDATTAGPSEQVIEIVGANQGTETDWQTVTWRIQRTIVVR
jgi:hypothetical protein